MRKFTKHLLALLLMVAGVVSVSAKPEQVHATFENAAPTGNASWDGSTNTFGWSATSWNQLKNIGLPSGDLSGYKKLVVDCTITEGDQFRVLFYQDAANKTLYCKDGVNEFIIADALQEVAPDDWNSFLKNCTEICLSGDNVTAPGSAIINDVYLETYDDEVEQVFASFENAAPTGNASWDSSTNTFGWSATSWNQLKNIGLPSGDLSGYKKLVVDCTITEGDQFRVLFYQDAANKTLYCKDGVNEFIIADALKEVAPDDWNSFLKNCTEVCLSGDNVTAPGSAIINSVYMETYPESEVVEIPDVVEEEDPGRPEGDYVDLDASLFNGDCVYNVGVKKAKGDFIYGATSQDLFADLSNYSKLTIIATPGTPLVLTFNHQIDFADKQNKEDYSEAEEGLYVWVDAVVDENGEYELDLTQFDPVNLNYIRIPWGYDKQSTVWYMLLTEKESNGEETSIAIEREVGQGYGAQSETIDFTAAKEYLGVEEITYDMIRIVNPDGTQISDYAPYDGWFNAEGVAEKWGDNTKICVKFFQMIENGKYEICDMNGADEVGATYNVKWALTANDKSYTYKIAVTFVPQKAIELAIADKKIAASVEYDSSEASYVEKKVTLSDEDEQAILSELGLTSLEDAKVYGYNPTTKELISAYAAYDGWRDANGDFATWTGTAAVPACVKYTDGKNYLCYNINGCDAQTVKTYWAIANDTKAVLVEIAFTYTSASEEPEDGLVEIEQSQGREYDDFARAELVEGEEYNTYTVNDDLTIAIKMMDVDVEGCDYVVVKFAEPVAAGWKLAFWSNQDLVDVPEGATEFKYVFAEDPKCGVTDGILPQICMMTFFGGYEKPLVAKVVGIYKHQAEGDPTAIKKIDTAAQKANGKYFQNGQIFIMKNGVKYNTAGQKIK